MDRETVKVLVNVTQLVEISFDRIALRTLPDSGVATVDLCVILCQIFQHRIDRGKERTHGIIAGIVLPSANYYTDAIEGTLRRCVFTLDLLTRIVGEHVRPVSRLRERRIYGQFSKCSWISACTTNRIGSDFTFGRFSRKSQGR